MTVLNEDKRPFRDLTPAERSEVVEGWVAGVIEAWDGGAWYRATSLSLTVCAIYRTRPIRHTIVHWDRLPRTVQFVARDSGGSVCAFNTSPRLGNSYWCATAKYGFVHIANFFPDAAEPGDEPWDESLQERPEGSAALGDLPEFVVSDEMVYAMNRVLNPGGSKKDAFMAAIDQWKKEQTK